MFNCDISQTSWNSASLNSTGNPVSNQYTYSYDALNRITGAIDNTGNYKLGNINYDKNGNLRTLQRYGPRNEGITDFGVMDNLRYTYDGNKLTSVTDLEGIAFGFKDGTNTGDDYTYDANGNMTEDKNKGISTIEYNHLNLPTSINFVSQYASINYVYDAVGVKQKKTVSGTGIPTTTTEYAGNYIYENDELQFFNHAEGYVKFESGELNMYINTRIIWAMYEYPTQMPITMVLLKLLRILAVIIQKSSKNPITILLASNIKGIIM